MNSSHYCIAQGIKTLVVLAYYKFVYIWNPKQTLEGVNTEIEPPSTFLGKNDRH